MMWLESKCGSGGRPAVAKVRGAYGSPGLRDLRAAVWLAEVGGPVGKVGVHEAPSDAPGVDLRQHMGVGVVARGG